jgi:hypothetical protein
VQVDAGKLLNKRNRRTATDIEMIGGRKQREAVDSKRAKKPQVEEKPETEILPMEQSDLLLVQISTSILGLKENLT